MKSNIVLAAVLLALSAFAYWYEFQNKPQRTIEEEAKGRLLSISPNAEPESVTIVEKTKAINLAMKCTEHCKLSDPHAKWQIVEPGKFKADEANVGTFITSIAGANVQETLPIEGDVDANLAGFGLGKVKREHSKVVLKFKEKDQPYTIYIGDNAAVGDNMYVYVEGPGQKQNVVRIVPAHLRLNFERKLSYWRAKRLFNFAAAEVESMKLVNPSGKIEIKKEGENWFLAGGRLADNEAVETFLTGVAFMTAKDFPLGKVKLPSNPKYELTLRPAKKEPITLKVYDVLEDSQPKVYGVLSDKNYVAELDRVGLEKFAKKADAFRFRNLITSPEKQEIAKVEVTFGAKEKFSFEKDGSSWKLVSGKIDGFKPELLDQSLTKIGAARIAEFSGKNGAPSGAALLSRWVLKKGDGKELRSFAVYGSNDKSAFYAVLQTGEQAVLERGSGSAIPSKADEFVKALPAAAPAAAPGTVPMQLPNGVMPQLPGQGSGHDGHSH